MTSDLAASPGADVDGAASAVEYPSPELGPGMAHRARSQSVLAQHWSPSGLIGAVGRTSVGFSLAVGRSRAIRPTVRYDDLNSAALRPSFELWRKRRDGFGDDPTPSDSGDRVGVSVDRRDESALVRRPRDASLDRRRVSGGATARPTWTDQIIQRSSVGFVAPAPGGPMPQPAIPTGFVSSGDAKLDRLRLLVTEREGGAVADRRDTSSSRGGDSIPLRRTTSAEPTVVTTLDTSTPGHLARSMRPEPAVRAPVPTARPGGGAPTAGAIQQRPDLTRPSAPGSFRAVSNESSRPAVRRSRRAASPDKADLLRAALIERGLLTTDPPGTGSDTHATQPIDAGSPETATADTETAGHDGSVAPTPSPRRRGTPAPLQDTRPATSSVDVDATRVTNTTAELHRATEDAGTSRPTTSRPSPSPSSPLPSSSSSSTPSTSRPQTSSNELMDRAQPSVVDSRSPGPPVVSASASQLRLQRLLRTGLGRADGAEVADPGIVEFDPVGSGQPGIPSSSGGASPAIGRAASAVATSSTIDRSAVAVLPTIARSALDPSQPVVIQPALLRAGAIESATVIRRVTLPRALSTQHRPPSIYDRSDHLAPTDLGVAPSRAATVSPPQGLAPRPSVMTLADVVATTSAAARPTSAADLGVASTITGSGVTSPVVRRSHSVVPPGTGALLDVVRRSPQRPRRRVERTVREPRAVSDDALPSAPIARTPGDALPSVPMARTRNDQPNDPTGHPDLHRAAETVRPARPAEQVAEQFMTALSETVRRQPAPLPTSFRPMADAIAGPRPIMLSTDTASRRALRSVGKVAATTGDTIHLDHRAIPSARLAEVMAHELTHVANPSPTPRFFDDIDDSPEERRAEQVAKVMARSPLAPAASLVAPLGHDGARTVRRTPAPPAGSSPARPARSSSPGGVTAEQLAAQLTGAPSGPMAGRSADVIRRTPTDAPTPSMAAAAPVIRRQETSSPAVGSTAQASRESASVMSDEQFLDFFRDNLSQVMRLIEDRMIIELERRGGRTWGAL